MAISIYDTQAQLPPIDFNFLADRLDKSEVKKDRNWDALNKAAANLPIQGGYQTQELAKKYNEQVINPLLDKYAAKISNNEPMNLWYPQYIKDVGNIARDPVYNTIKEDEAYKQTVQAQMKEPDFAYSIQDYYHPQFGFNQVSEQDIARGWTAPAGYNIERPKDINPDFKDYYSQIKPILEKDFGSPIKSFEYDPNGNPIAVLETTYGEQVKKIDRNRIRDIVAPMVMNNFPALMGSKQSLRYKAALYSRMNPNFQYNELSAINDIADGFLGEFEDRVEMQPRTVKTNIPKPKTTGVGVGIGAANVGGLPNEVALTLNKLGNVDAEGNLAGKTKVRSEVLVPMIGGRKEGNNFVVSFDSNNPAFLQVPKAVSGSSKEEDFSLAKALPYKVSYENAKENLLEDMTDIAENQVRSVKGLDKDGNQIGFSYLPDGTIGYKDAYAMQNPLSGWTSKISVDEFINNYLQNTELANNPNNLQLSSLARQAKEQFGINLADPNIQAKIDKISSSEQGKLYQEVAQSLASLQGNYQFYTDNSSDNLFLDDSGTPIAKGFIVLNKDELEQIFPNYDEAVDQGIIASQGFEEVINEKGKKEKVAKYKIPVYRGTDADIDNTTQSYVDAAYGSRKDVDELRQGFLETSRSAFDALSIGKRGYQKFNNDFNAAVASKEAEPLKGDLMDASLELGKIDNASATQANAEIIDLYNRYQDKKISKAALKKELYLMYLALQVKIAQQGDPTLQVPELELFLKTKEAFK